MARNYENVPSNHQFQSVRMKKMYMLEQLAANNSLAKTSFLRLFILFSLSMAEKLLKLETNHFWAQWSVRFDKIFACVKIIPLIFLCGGVQFLFIEAINDPVYTTTTSGLLSNLTENTHKFFPGNSIKTFFVLSFSKHIGCRDQNLCCYGYGRC